MELNEIKGIAEKALKLETGEHYSGCAYHGGYACTCQNHALYRHELALGVISLLKEREALEKDGSPLQLQRSLKGNITELNRQLTACKKLLKKVRFNQRASQGMRSPKRSKNT